MEQILRQAKWLVFFCEQHCASLLLMYFSGCVSFFCVFVLCVFVVVVCLLLFLLFCSFIFILS